MDSLKDWLYPSTQVGDIVRMRPLALENLYNAGVDPWTEAELTLEEVCRRAGLSLRGLLRDLAELPALPVDTPWEERPLCYLIDHLVAEHRAILLEDLPAIRTALDEPREGIPRDEEVLDLVTRAFHAFSGKLKAHLAEEEDSLFPALLRNEYLLRNSRGAPGAATMAGKLETAAGLLEGEEDFDRALRYLLEQARVGSVPGAGDTAAQQAIDLIARLGGRIEAHARLEREVLLPRAEAIERELAALAVA